MAKLKVSWLDSGREPQCPPDPKYPDGVALDVSEGASETCETSLPYPARRCGMYTVVCPECGLSATLTTAGRPDDPKSVKVPCRTWAKRGEAHGTA